MMRILIGILVVGIVLISGCLLSSWRSEEPEESPTVSGVVNDPQLGIKTDKDVYGVGNEFTIRHDVNAAPASESKPSPSSVKTETVVSHPNQPEWTNSEDGVLSLRLSSDKEEYVSGESIEVKIELRNNSRSTVRVAALVYASGAYGNALSVTGPGQIEYHGPYKELYAPPLEISPGEIRQETSVLALDNWKGLDVKGDYTVSCTYHSGSTNQDEGLWYGTIRSGTVQFKITK